MRKVIHDYRKFKVSEQAINELKEGEEIEDGFEDEGEEDSGRNFLPRTSSMN